MGYQMLLLPVPAGREPLRALRGLIRGAENNAPEPAKEVRKARLASRLRSIEPALEIFPKDPRVIARALPELHAGQVAHLARTVELTGWNGIQIRLCDGWAEIEIATWPQLNNPATLSRLARVIEVIIDETGWALLDGEEGVLVTPRAGVAGAVGRALERHARIRGAPEDRSTS